MLAKIVNYIISVELSEQRVRGTGIQQEEFVLLRLYVIQHAYFTTSLTIAYIQTCLLVGGTTKVPSHYLW